MHCLPRLHLVWRWGPVAAVCGLLGCSMHPLPEDVTGVTTLEIVERIRCEAKEGLLSLPRRTAREIAHIKRIVEGTSIGLEFDFLIREDNRAAGGSLILDRRAAVGFPDTGVNIALRADLNANDAETARKNVRVFRVVEDLKDIYDANCSKGVARANHVYPITGATGMGEVVQTYVNLEILTDLGKTGEGKEAVVFSDELVFRTVFETATTPDLKVNTAIGSLRITRASITGSASRSDVHSVTIVLARDEKHVDVDLPPRGPRGSPEAAAREKALAARKAAGKEAPPATTMRHMLIAKDLNDKSLQTGLAQKDAGARNRILLELQRKRNQREDRSVVTRVLTGASP